MNRKSPKTWPAALLVAALVALLPLTAHGIVVERVVAVVGEKAILLSDLRLRAKPLLIQVYRKVPPGPQRAAAESKFNTQVLERMVDEELEALAAARTSTSVTSDDIDKALERIAAMARVSVAELLEDVRVQSGLTEQEYRQEIRRQVLETKLVQRLVQSPSAMREQDLQAMYKKVKQDELRRALYNPGWIVLRLGKDPSPELLAHRTKLARDIVAQARAGSDFRSLAMQYSDDPETAESGGNLGFYTPLGSPAAEAGKHPTLAPALERVVLGLKAGEIAEPIRYEDSLVILALFSRQPTRFPSYEAAKEQMMQIVQNERMQKAKEKWLKDLRRRTHVDIRL